MSDGRQTLVLLDVPATGADAMAARLVTWLAARGVVEANRSDCVLGAEGGHRPAGHARAACTADFANGLLVNGLQLETGGLIFGAPEFDDLLCPHCGTPCLLDDVGDALLQWRRTAHASALCPACGVESDITQWIGGDGWALGRVALTFWNWPPLAPAFTRELAAAAGFGVRLVASRV